MEEKKSVGVSQETQSTNQKLSYEQLEAYTQQTIAQAERIFEENKQLKQMLQLRDMDYVFKCLAHHQLFSKEFIASLIKRIESSFVDFNTEETDKEG